MRSILFILLLSSLRLFAIDSPPKILRACINYDDSTVTISWQAPADLCGSFTHYNLYEQINAGPFMRIAQIPVLGVQEYPHKITDLNTNRSYYIVVHSYCNMIDSGVSQTISIDVSYPANLQLDSVSYDLTTQNIIAGWQNNSSPDTRGYQIYDYSSGNGDSIGFTSNTAFTVTTDPNDVFPVVIATLDSCNLSSILSNPHRVMRLTENLDTCRRRVRLNWSSYQGWQSIDSQHVMVSTNYGPFVLRQVLGGNSTSVELNNIILGDTLCIYIRAFTAAGTITSSSNKVCVETKALESPSYIYLSRVTVVGDHDVLLEWETDNVVDQKKFYIWRSDNGIPYVRRMNEVITDPAVLNYSATNITVNVHEDYHTYKIISENVCNEESMVSNEATTIRLGFLEAINHNAYEGFDGGVQQYELQKRMVDGFTWNTLRIQDTPFNNIDFEDSAGCYRVLATEYLNSYGYFKTSLSNTECVLEELSFFWPNAINLLTENNRFKIYGKGIDHSRSYYQIFNRWGEQLAVNKSSEAWYGEYQGEFVPQGVYICIGVLYGILGEKEVIKDYIYVYR